MYSTSQHTFGAKNSDLSHEDVAKFAIRDFDGPFHFVEENLNGVEEFHALALKGLRLSREGRFAKGEEADADLAVEGSFVNLEACEAPQRQRDHLRDSSLHTPKMVSEHLYSKARQMKTVETRYSRRSLMLLSRLCC